MIGERKREEERERKGERRGERREFIDEKGDGRGEGENCIFFFKENENEPRCVLLKSWRRVAQVGF